MGKKRACGHEESLPGHNCPTCLSATGLKRRGGLGDSARRVASATKPRIEKGKPHCPECVEKKKEPGTPIYTTIALEGVCDCKEDQFCARYNRWMGGRMREICSGVNVDLGTAASFRDQWKRESNTEEKFQGPPLPLLLKTNQAPGDTVASTAAIYSLHKSYPGKYLTAVDCPHPEVFKYNPNVVDAEMLGKSSNIVHLHYPAVHESNSRGIHFMQGWCEFLGSALGVSIPLLTNRPQLYFLDSPPSVEDYWLICSGGKQDFTNKLWGQHNYQAVVSMLTSKVKFLQVGNIERGHIHHPLVGVESAVGKTTLRELFDLVRRARGVLCGVSLLMHVAAALEKPAVVIAGGREPVQWNSYPKQHYIHTVGALPCKSTQGEVGGACWRSRVRPLNDGSQFDKDPCERPVGDLPECMTMIRPAQVADLILRYNRQYEHNADR